MKIKVKNKLVLVILSAVILVIPVGISTFQEQQAYAPRTCGSCAQFLKLTAQFERDVGQATHEFAIENHPNNIPYAEFKKLTAEFKTDFLHELLQNPQSLINFEVYLTYILKNLIGYSLTFLNLFNRQ
jgi:hypothetical protein